MRKLRGFGIIEPGCMNPYKGIIYKVLCLSQVFIPAEGNGGKESSYGLCRFALCVTFFYCIMFITVFSCIWEAQDGVACLFVVLDLSTVL